MNDKLTTILYLVGFTVAAMLLFYFLGVNTKDKTESKTSDTSKVITTTITTTENTFTAAQVGNIKRALIDSLTAIYGKKISALMKLQTSAKEEASPFAPSTPLRVLRVPPLNDSVFISEVDTNFVAKDSTGFVTDSISVNSAFVSPTELNANSIHLLNIHHKSFNRNSETRTTINNKEVVIPGKSFFERFSIIPNVSAGYGYFNKKFDVFVGVGITYEF